MCIKKEPLRKQDKMSVSQWLFFSMDLAGIEPASESLSLAASPITVILLTFPHITAG